MPDRMVAVGGSIIGRRRPQGYLDCFDAVVRDAYEAMAGGEPRDSLPTSADGAPAAHVTAAVVASSASGAWEPVLPGERPVSAGTPQPHATAG